MRELDNNQDLPIKFLISIFTFSMLTTSYATEYKSNYLTFNFGWRSVEVPHNETSSATGFAPLDHLSKIPVISLRLGFEKEIFPDEYVSFTPQAFAGAMMGRQKKDLTEKNQSYNDKASGTFYGFGGTVNANFKYSKTMRIQPFGGFNLVKSSAKYKLAYTPYTSETPQINFDYSEDRTQSHILGGVRIFDSKSELFSIFTVEYEVASTVGSFSNVSKINESTITIENPTAIDHSPLGVTVGFGMMF